MELSEAQYRAASFLDDRILPLTGPPQWTAWTEIDEAAQGLAGGCDFIFHVGHVGSTLLARLLGHSPRVFCLREPAILRALARLDDETLRARRTPAVVRLLGRVWRPEQRALVKATSFVGEIAPALAAAAADARSILMFSAPHIYIAGIFAGEASRREMNILAPARLARLDRRAGLGWSIGDLGEGERAAMSWACEFMALAQFAARAARPALWVDFDRFLEGPRQGLARVLLHLHGEAPTQVVDAMLGGGELSRYAKAPEHPFDAHFRRRVIAQAQAEHREEIEQGLAWLNALGAGWPPFADAARTAVAAARSP